MTNTQDMLRDELVTTKKLTKHFFELAAEETRANFDLTEKLDAANNTIEDMKAAAKQNNKRDPLRFYCDRLRERLQDMTTHNNSLAARLQASERYNRKLLATIGVNDIPTTDKGEGE